VPLLALGQTVFWDEPMKGGVALASRRLGYKRRFVAGVHERTTSQNCPAGSAAAGLPGDAPHDTSTKGLWSAAGEFSTLFGSETVISRDALAAAGLRIDRLREIRPKRTGRGHRSLGMERGSCPSTSTPRSPAHVPLRQIFGELYSTFDWALDHVPPRSDRPGLGHGEGGRDTFRSQVCDRNDPALSVSEFYKSLLPEFYSTCANADVRS